jgi:hypothetical protein
MFHVPTMVDRHQPRPNDAPIDLFAKRLEICRTCPARRSHQCQPAHQLVTILARRKNAICPRRLWPGDPPEPAPIAAPPKPAGRERLTTLHALTTLFNPQRDPRIFANYDRFRRGMEAAGVVLWTIELAFDDDPFHLAPQPRVIQVRGTRADNLIWQKERLLRILLSYVPWDADAIAWIDADTELLNPRWPAETLYALGEKQVVQLFDNAYQVRPDGTLEHIRPSTGYHYAHHGPDADPNTRRHHPGFAWAARSSWLRKYGFEDRTVCSFSDAIMARAFGSGMTLDPAIPAGMLRSIEDWSLPVSQAVAGKLGYVAGTLLHSWHGDLKKRGYYRRWLSLVDHNFDPATDLVEDHNRLWTWSDFARHTKPDLIAAVADCYTKPTPD